MSHAKSTPGPYLRAGDTIYALGFAPVTRGKSIPANRMSAQVVFGWADREVVTEEEKEATIALLRASPALADALYFALEEEGGIDDSEICDDVEGCGCWPSIARAALRAAGRLP